MLTRDARLLGWSLTMTTNSEEAGSAKIYQFPARGRFAAVTPRESKPTAIPPQHVAAVSGGWYHDEAIQDAERARKS
jgi:hypothetical protein